MSRSNLINEVYTEHEQILWDSLLSASEEEKVADSSWGETGTGKSQNSADKTWGSRGCHGEVGIMEFGLYQVSYQGTWLLL